MKLSQRDQRQLIRLLERLELFKNGTLDLTVIIKDIEFLLDEMDNIDQNEKNAIRKNWLGLEVEHAEMLESGKITNSDQLIHQNIEEIKARVKKLLA